MPKGVEHLKLQVAAAVGIPVRIPLMPKGVEHIGKAGIPFCLNMCGYL